MSVTNIGGAQAHIHRRYACVQAGHYTHSTTPRSDDVQPLLRLLPKTMMCSHCRSVRSSTVRMRVSDRWANSALLQCAISWRAGPSRGQRICRQVINSPMTAWSLWQISSAAPRLAAVPHD